MHLKAPCPGDLKTENLKSQNLKSQNLKSENLTSENLKPRHFHLRSFPLMRLNLRGRRRKACALCCFAGNPFLSGTHATGSASQCGG